MPLFFPMLLGYIYQRCKPIPDDTLGRMNQIMFQLFLPLMLFGNIYGSIIDYAASSRLILFLLGFVTVLFVLLSIGVPKVVKEPSRRGTVIQGIMRANSAVYGIPIATILLGEAAIPMVSLVIATIVVPFNLYSILALELNRDEKPKPGKIIKQMLTNPLLISIAGAMLCNALQLRIPVLLVSCVRQVGSIATPFAFFVLGASFTFRAAAKNKRVLALATIMRLVVVPAYYLLPAVLMGFRGAELVCVLLVGAPPTSVSSFPMATAMGGDSELASELVVFTSAFSIITMFLWVWLLKVTGLV